MHEITKYNKNFTSSEVFEQKVMKPDQASRNTATIQLFGADGALIEEAYTENAISPIFESYGYTSIANSLCVGSVPSNTGNMLPQTILLTDSAISEMEDLYTVHGNCVGFCGIKDSSSSGSYHKKGTYNTPESYSRVEDGCIMHYHLVYDWPTSAGNGKIQAIYWLPYTVSPNISEIYKSGNVAFSTVNTPLKSPNVYFDKHGGAYLYANGYFKITNFLKYAMRCEPMILESAKSYYTGVETSGNYYTCKSYTSKPNTPQFQCGTIIEKRNFKGNIVDQWDLDLIAGIPQLEELRRNSKLGVSSAGYNLLTFSSYCNDAGWVSVRIAMYGNDNIFPSYNSTTDTLTENATSNVAVYSFYNVLTKRWLHPLSPWYKQAHDSYALTDAKVTTYKLSRGYMHTSIEVLNIDGNSFIVSTNGNYKCLFNIEDGSVLADYYGTAANNACIYANDSASFKSKHSELPICINLYESIIQIIRPITAHTRLAAPIVKTSLNTMKIQYDFFYKIPLPFMPPDKVWALYDEE